MVLIRQVIEMCSTIIHIVIDDGRRWLLGHPDRRFDFILMNTTWHYRAHVSNLLSTEFMGLMREHLNRGGIAYYNTTYSGDALVTGATAFPYALRINSFLAVSNSPITLDKSLWRTPTIKLTDVRSSILASQINARGWRRYCIWPTRWTFPAVNWNRAPVCCNG